MCVYNYPLELCDSPDQVADYHISTQHLTGHRVKKVNSSILNFASLKNILVLAIIVREQNSNCVGLQSTVNYLGSKVWFITNTDIIRNLGEVLLFCVFLNHK
jgi:hypothetical protein